MVGILGPSTDDGKTIGDERPPHTQANNKIRYIAGWCRQNTNTKTHQQTIVGGTDGRHTHTTSGHNLLPNRIDSVPGPLPHPSHHPGREPSSTHRAIMVGATTRGLLVLVARTNAGRGWMARRIHLGSQQKGGGGVRAGKTYGSCDPPGTGIRPPRKRRLPAHWRRIPGTTTTTTTTIHAEVLGTPHKPWFGTDPAMPGRWIGGSPPSGGSLRACSGTAGAHGGGDHHHPPLATGETGGVSWNRRAREFLLRRRTGGAEEEVDPRALSKLLDELLLLRNSGVEDERFDDDEEEHEVDWTERKDDDDDDDAKNPSLEPPPHPTLAMRLLDCLADDAGAALGGHQHQHHHDLLNTVLQLWRSALVDEPTGAHRSPEDDDDDDDLPPLLSPAEVLSKLDDHRVRGGVTTIGPPDVRSYNILLEGAAGRGDTELCHGIYEWMWKESGVDHLLQPNVVTLRAMFKACLYPGDDQNEEEEARAEACERLVEDYLQRTTPSLSSSSSTSSFLLTSSQQKDIGAIHRSLIHVWAPRNPRRAEEYLHAMARKHLDLVADNDNDRTSQDKHYEYLRHPPPDAMAWNRVISAWAITHRQPSEAARLLEDFWAFCDCLPPPATRQQPPPGTTTGTNDRAPPALQPDLFSYNAVLEGWAKEPNAAKANQTYDQIRAAASLRPNIMTYTSAIRANLSPGATPLRERLARIEEIARDCLDAHEEEESRRAHERLSGGTTPSSSSSSSSSDHPSTEGPVLDHGFFHAWLQAYVHASQELSGADDSRGEPSEKDGMSARELVDRFEEIMLETMPSVNLPPNGVTFNLLLESFLVRDDLEGATQWMLAHLKDFNDERTIVYWTHALLQIGDIEVMSFLDRLLGRANLFSRHKKPKTLLQILVEGGKHLTQASSIERLLTRLPAEQGLQVLRWTPPDLRTPKAYSLVLRALAHEGDGKGAEDLWEIWKSSRRNDHVNDGADDIRKSVAEMYTSIIVAWSKNRDAERTQHWFRAWQEDRELEGVPPSIPAQVAVLSSLGEAMKPNQAETFVRNLQALHQSEKLPCAPDLAMHNMVLKAWVLAASGARAQKYLTTMVASEVGTDIISYNSVVQAYIKERKLERALQFVREVMIEQNDQMPDLATFRSILWGWSKSRDVDAAKQQCAEIVQWMQDLHSTGVLQDSPDDDYQLQQLIEKCKSSRRGHRSKHSRRKRPKERKEQ